MAKAMYVGVDGKARKVKKIYVGVGSSLPSGYTQLEYVQSNGSQYINTGFKPKSTTRAVLDIDVTAKSSQSAIFGARNGSASSGFNVWTYNNNAGYQFDYGAQQYVGVGGTSSGRHTIEINQNVLSVDGSTVQSASSQSFSCSYNAYIFMVNSGGSLMTSYPCSAKLYSCQIYDNGTLVRNFVPCKNSSGTVGLYDLVNNAFYTHEGSGTLTAGSALSSGGVARKVKKGYIGVGGVARPFFSAEPTLAYYGKLADLNEKKGWMGSASIGNYALLAGGANSTGGYYNTVEVYDTSLVKSLKTLSATMDGPAGATVGNYAVFGGGSRSTTRLNTVNAFNASLTRSTPTALSQARSAHSATSVGNYALFGGGYTGSAQSAVVDAYNASLTRSTPTALTKARSNLSATSVGDYALFCGGTNYATVDAYNASLTRSTPTELSVGRVFSSATSIGNYALIAGGYNSSSFTFYSTVDAYNTSLTRSTPTSMSETRSVSSTSTSNYALFGGNGFSYKKIVDVFNKSLAKSTVSFGEEYGGSTAVSVGRYAIFARHLDTHVEAFVEIE